MTDNTLNLFWTDLETTGLDPDTDQILEVAAIVTNAELKILASFHAVIGKDPSLRMNNFVWKMHTGNGLLDEIEAHDNGTTKVSKDVSHWIVRGPVYGIGPCLADFVRDYAPKAPMAGSTIGFDRAFYRRHLPMVEELLHYRNFDVSVYREAVKRWASWMELPPKNGTHRAMDDIKASIEVAKTWKEHLGVYGALVAEQG
jgi:oligoribonuclease